MRAEILNKVINIDALPKIKDVSHNYGYYIEQIDELAKADIPRVFFNDFINTIRTSKFFGLYETMLDSIKREYLFQSYTHGVYHNERTSLYAFYLAIKLGLEEKDVVLSLYAAMYHDIGRVDDSWDEGHGKRSADKLDSLNLPVTEEELQILKAIINGHSLSDEMFPYLLLEYGIRDVERARVLFSIIKDADAIDRTRLNYPIVGLEYLRNDESKTLVPLSYEIFNFYYKNTNG